MNALGYNSVVLNVFGLSRISNVFTMANEGSLAVIFYDVCERVLSVDKGVGPSVGVAASLFVRRAYCLRVLRLGQ